MEQIHTNGLSIEKNCWSCLLCLIELPLKMIGWKEQEPGTKLSINYFKLSIAHTKACCNLFGMG